MESHMSSNSDNISFNPRSLWRMRLLAIAATVTTTLLAACGGSGTGSSQLQDGTGAAVISMQDAAGDFQSYTVDVVSLKLTKATGAVVETLPATERVDFAQLVD